MPVRPVATAFGQAVERRQMVGPPMVRKLAMGAGMTGPEGGANGVRLNRCSSSSRTRRCRPARAPAAVFDGNTRPSRQLDAALRPSARRSMTPLGARVERLASRLDRPAPQPHRRWRLLHTVGTIGVGVIMLSAHLRRFSARTPQGGETNGDRPPFPRTAAHFPDCRLWRARTGQVPPGVESWDAAGGAGDAGARAVSGGARLELRGPPLLKPHETRAKTIRPVLGTLYIRQLVRRAGPAVGERAAPRRGNLRLDCGDPGAGRENVARSNPDLAVPGSCGRQRTPYHGLRMCVQRARQIRPDPPRTGHPVAVWRPVERRRWRCEECVWKARWLHRHCAATGRPGWRRTWMAA